MDVLYRKTASTFEYWEAWDSEDAIVVHSGEVGHRGNTEERDLNHDADAEAIIDELIAAKLEEGYSTIDPDDHWTIIVKHPIPGKFGDDASMNRRHALMEGLDELVRWAGAGEVEGGDIGGGHSYIYVLVVETETVIQRIQQWLEVRGDLGDATIAIEKPGSFESDDDDNDPVVVWPPDFEGEFSYL